MSKRSSAGVSKPAALVLAPEAPYPVIGGGPLRTASLLEYLSGRYLVDVVVFREPDAPDPRDAFPRGVVRDVALIELPYHSKNSFSRAARNLGRLVRGMPPLVDRFSGFEAEVQAFLNGRHYELGLVEHFWCAGYGKLLRSRCRRSVLDLHNVESVLLSRCAKSDNWAASAAMQHFASACRKLEERWLPDFDLVLVTSKEDRLPASTPTIVYPNSIPYVPVPTVPKCQAVVFSGNLEYHPNASAIRFFLHRIWPALRNRWPDLEWHIVGKNPLSLPGEIQSDPRIKIIGSVKDAVNAIAACQCAVAPLLAGSGTRVKIIEAWAAGVPVVSTAVGAEGLPCTDGKEILIADEPADFVRAVSSLLQDPELAKRIGQNGRTLYESELTWQAAWQQLELAGF